MNHCRTLPLRTVALAPFRRTKATAAGSVTVNKAPWSPLHIRLWNAYQKSLEKSPLLTKAVMASFIFFASDTATQFAMSGTKGGPSKGEHSLEGAAGQVVWRWDAARALSGAGFGVVATSWLHYWWGFLETSVGRVLPVQRYRLANTLTKVALDQLLGAPFYIYSYYVVTNFLQDLQDRRVPALQSLQENNDKASEMLWPTMMQHWKLWPIVHSFNFYFAPLHHRVLVQNCVLVGWSGYLSHLNHSSSKLMTPDEEIKESIVRRETAMRLKEDNDSSR